MIARFKIEGMFCAACSCAVEKALSKAKGVTEASVNLPLESARVVYDESVTDADTLFEAVRMAGYRAMDYETYAKEGKAAEEKRRRSARIRLALSLVVAFVLMALAMWPMLANIHMGIAAARVSAVVQFVLCAGVIALGADMFARGARNLLRLKPNMDSLVTLGAGLTFLYSLYISLRIMLGDAAALHHLYFESAGMIVALVQLGRYLELSSRDKAGSAVSALMKLTQGKALRIRDGIREEVSPESLAPGDAVLVMPGERIPIDGFIQKGRSAVNESVLTGEEAPADKAEGGAVFAGTVCVDGSLLISVTKHSAETELQRIIDAVEEAQGTKAPIARLADKIAGVFTYCVIGAAALTFTAWMLAGAGFETALRLTSSVLMIACPCAMGLATPTAIMAGMGRGAEAGILYKNAEALEKSANTQIIAFDKTGTLTTGEMSAREVVCRGDRERFVRVVASVEAGSAHPLAKAIGKLARDVELMETKRLVNHPGAGVEAVADNVDVLVGNAAFMRENGVDAGDYAGDAARMESDGMSVVYAALGGMLSGIIGVSDTVRPDAHSAVEALRDMGIKTVMISGDIKARADTVAHSLGIDEVYAEVRPEGKARIIDALKRQGSVAMAGDGINDAVALTLADTGIAVGAASAIALDAADAVVRGGEAMAVQRLVKLSRASMRIIRENLFWAFIYNIIGIPIAAGVLYAFGGPMLDPMFAAAAMGLSSVSVVLNALRLTKLKL